MAAVSVPVPPTVPPVVLKEPMVSLPPNLYSPEERLTVPVLATTFAEVVSNVPPLTTIPDEAKVTLDPVLKEPAFTVVVPP